MEVEAIVGVQISEYILETDPTYADHVFIGWYTDELLTTPYVPTDLVADDATLYAKWEEIFDITYTLNSGTNSGTNPTTLTESDLPITLEPATRVGYTFDGWYAEVGLTTPAGTIAVAEDVTVYAKWLQNFTVTFDLNGGNVGGSEADITAVVPTGTLVGSAQPDFTPVYTGKVWTTPYWVTTAIGSTDASSTEVTADVTVYAYWVTA